MAFDVSSAKGVRSSVNITPLIDVVLVLLIIFMVMTPTTMKHLKPQFAQESATVAPAGPQPVLVEMDLAGVTVDGEKTPWTQVFDRVKGRLERSRQTAVFFKIADEVDYGEAVRLFDVCRGAGAQVLGLPPGHG
jgi:biopolymer transport protein ExbD